MLKASQWCVHVLRALLSRLPFGRSEFADASVQLVELKNGVTFNGHLVEVDNFMNVTLREVYQTSADGERFWKMKEMFIKGNIVRLPSPRPEVF